MPNLALDSDGLLPGFASRAGTRRYASRIEHDRAERGLPVSADHFARPDELWLSSLSLGTLRGTPGGSTTCSIGASSGISSKAA